MGSCKFHVSHIGRKRRQSNQAVLSSVVFASAYRTSVLFTYDAMDPSYTLAPTVGWTAIEMAAGIVSANLPTMLPVFRWLARAVGINSLAGTIRGMSTGDSKGNGTSGHTHELSSREPALRNHSKRESFYRLPDDNDSDYAGGERGMGGNQLNLRPDKQKFKVTINTASSRDDKDEDSGDEVALNRICVQKEVTQTSRIV